MRFQRLSTFVSALLAVLLIMAAGVSAAAAENMHLVYEARGHVITVDDAAAAAGWGQNVVFRRSGSDLQGSAVLATGDEVYADMSAGSGSTYTVIVRGDLCGSGKPGITQLTAVAAALKNPEALDAVHRYAADLDGSGAIGLADLVKAARYMTHPAPDGPVYPSGPKPLTAADAQAQPSEGPDAFTAQDIPAYEGQPWTAVHGNIPYFDTADYTPDAWETYSALDDLGRCGPAFACVGLEVMPTATRAPISEVKPSGWQTVKYPDVVPGGYLYNRCHLIGFQLTAEDANAMNLITGTRALNIDGMLPFENMVADYVEETQNHVLYRVTPIFVGSELVARGVLIEASSVEDGGEDIEFCVFAHNVQPGIVIDYSTGESQPDAGMLPGVADPEAQPTAAPSVTYVLNTKSLKFHLPDCSSAGKLKPDTRQDFFGTKEELVQAGYVPCKICKP